MQHWVLALAVHTRTIQSDYMSDGRYEVLQYPYLEMLEHAKFSVPLDHMHNLPGFRQVLWSWVDFDVNRSRGELPHRSLHRTLKMSRN